MQTDINKNKFSKYQDPDDEIFNSGLRKSEYPDSWNGGDNFALKTVMDNFTKYELNPKDSVMLDAGAGTGTWSILFSPYFKEIIAAEPDGSQINHFKSAINYNIEAKKKISIVQASIQAFDYPADSFRFILCSHVIQHISKTDVNLVLAKLFNLLQKNGILALFTTHSQCGYSRYLLQYSKTSEEFVSEETFESSFNNKEPDCFPTRKFSREELFGLAENIGFTILDDKVYHMPYLAPGSEKEMNMDSDKKRNHGMDQILILTKY